MNARQLLIGTSLVVMLLASGCDRLDMYDQPRYDPLAASNFFADGRSARPQVEGTIARGHLDADIPLVTGKESGQFVSQIPEGVWQKLYDRDPRRFHKPLDQVKPQELRLALLERGEERYNIYCSVCHSRLGDGNGMIVRRGFRKPPSFHIERLRNAPDGHFFDVVTRGIGAMPSYASRIAVIDRWAIVAYIRALQLSENAHIDDVPEKRRSELLKQTPVSAAAQGSGSSAPDSQKSIPGIPRSRRPSHERACRSGILPAHCRATRGNRRHSGRGGLPGRLYADARPVLSGVPDRLHVLAGHVAGMPRPGHVAWIERRRLGTIDPPRAGIRLSNFAADGCVVHASVAGRRAHVSLDRSRVCAPP